MKILVVSSYLPFPLHSGGHIRLYNILKKLSSNHDITLVCEKRTHQTEEDVARLKEICKKVITVPRKRQWSMSNVLYAGISKNPFLIVGHNSAEMRSKIQEELNTEKFDLIHAETFYISQNIPKTHIPLIIAEHNIEHLVYKRFADKASYILKPLLYFDIQKLKSAEESAWKKADAVIAVSDEDESIIKRFNVKTFVISNGVDLERFKFKSTEKKQDFESVLYIGDFKWVQNRDAVRFILRDIWPALQTNSKNLKFKIVGKNIPDDIKNYFGNNIEIDEKAPDETSKIFAGSDVLLAPIRVGGGSSYKILEAMASGMPVVTTELGAIGLGAVDSEQIIIADKAKEIIDRTQKLLSDNEYYNKIARNARAFIEKKYDWNIIASDLEKAYKVVLNS